MGLNDLHLYNSLVVRTSLLFKLLNYIIALKYCAYISVFNNKKKCVPTITYNKYKKHSSIVILLTTSLNGMSTTPPQTNYLLNF